MPKKLLYLILITGAIRMIVAAVLELSNDEVYYFLYALDLQPNYFDHPPGVGILIRLFTANLSFTHEFFVRLGAIVCAGVGTVFMYDLGKLLKNEQTGWFAAILYNTSVYTSVIAGTFIIPDSPQVVCWLASLWFMYKIILQADRAQPVSMAQWFLFGLQVGLCILCKVHGIFLWFGFGLYVLFYQRSLLKSPGLYFAAIITLITISPIVWWNVQNDFITYRFHSERVAVQESMIHPDYFVQAVGGQILYNNPINVVLMLVALWKLRTLNFLDRTGLRFILLNGLPIVLVVSGMSLFNSMLPHWSGPGFLTLSLLAAAYLDERVGDISRQKLPIVLRSGILLLGTVLVAAVLLIRYYPGTLGSRDQMKYGDGDFTLDMYGWKQLAAEFKPWLLEKEKSNVLPAGIKIVSHKWFPAAHIDYYVALPLHRSLVGVGDVTDLHQYYWLNRSRPVLQKGDNAICILPSNNTVNMEETYLRNFKSAELLHTFENRRGGETARYFTVYLLKDYQMNDELHEK